MKVMSVQYTYYETEDKKGKHTFKTNCKVEIWLEETDGIYKCNLEIRPGFKCDGLSVPVIFRWFLPSWDSKNGLYNLAGVIHDGLYANKGICIFSREQVDDIFRGLLRESGICRFKAGCADKAVEWFAGGNEHWSSDQYHCKDLIKLKLFKRMD